MGPGAALHGAVNSAGPVVRRGEGSKSSRNLSGGWDRRSLPPRVCTERGKRSQSWKNLLRTRGCLHSSSIADNEVQHPLRSGERHLSSPFAPAIRRSARTACGRDLSSPPALPARRRSHRRQIMGNAAARPRAAAGANRRDHDASLRALVSRFPALVLHLDQRVPPRPERRRLRRLPPQFRTPGTKTRHADLSRNPGTCDRGPRTFLGALLASAWLP